MPISIAHLGLDESGSLPSEANWFVMAGVLTDRPEAAANLIQLETKIRVAQVSDWQTIKRQWIARGK